MNWNKNVSPFIPSLPFNDDWTDYSVEKLESLSMWHNMLQITITDNSMYDRFLKNDIINIKLEKDPTNPFFEENDGLILLPDDSVIFRHYQLADDKIVLSPIYSDFCEPETYNIDDVNILGIATAAIR